MLRITIQHDTPLTRFLVEGKLAGEWARELERCWLEAVGAQSPRIRIELTDVSFIDEAGRALLARMAATGAELTAVDVLTKSIVDEIVYDGRRRRENK